MSEAASGRAAPQAVPVPVAELFAVAQEYVEAGRLDAAERLLAHILRPHPDQAGALHLKGLIAFRRNRLEEAVALMEASLAQGGSSGQWRNLGEAYRLVGRLEEALAAVRRAVSLDPADPLGPFNAAMIHYDRLDIPAALAAARHALDLRPDLPQAHMKLAQVLLLSGNFPAGWAEYEWRFRIPGAAPLMPATDRPQWDGAALDDNLLLIADQGYGDALMFARYLPWVRARAKRVMLACSAELDGAMQALLPDLPRFTNWTGIPPYAAYCPLSGLPRLHGTTLETIPPVLPLVADPAKAAAWRTRLDQALPPGTRRVGLAWAGRPSHNNDRNRSLALADFAPLADLPGTAFVSLQKGPAAAQVQAWRGAAPLLDLTEGLAGFDDTAAVVAGLDLVVTVDTAVAHLSGTVGAPTWVLLPHAPDWRWLLGRDDTPWYPSLRLFRAPGPRRLPDAIPVVARELRQVVAREPRQVVAQAPRQVVAREPPGR